MVKIYLFINYLIIDLLNTGATVAAKRDLAPRRDASKHQQAPSVFATKRRATCKQVMKEQAVTASRKRKLERIKAPVVVFRKTKTSKGL